MLAKGCMAKEKASAYYEVLRRVNPDITVQHISISRYKFSPITALPMAIVVSTKASVVDKCGE